MRFIVDANVGRLAVWLRALGYDTKFQHDISDADLVEIAQNERRIILTKDHGIMARKIVTSGQVRVHFVDGFGWRAQLGHVVRQLKLTFGKEFTRCLECNVTLANASREQARAHVPAGVHGHQESYLYCPSCKRYFWRGSHWQRMSNVLRSCLNG